MSAAQPPMAENSASASPQLQSPPAAEPPVTAAATPQNPSITSPQIPPSPSISDLSQLSSPQIPIPQSHLDAAAAAATGGALDYAARPPPPPMQPQQGLMSPSSGFQMGQMQPGLQRSGSVTRMNQYGAAAGAVRMYAGGGQMSFGGAQAARQQQQMAAGMSRPGMVGQVGQLPVLPGQSAAHYALQSQMMSQPRQKGLVQGSQFNSANVGQTLQGIQTMGVMNSLGLNPQLRANGPLLYGQQQSFAQQMRPQQLSAQAAMSSPQKLAGQGLQRAPSLAAVNPQLSGFSHNGQSVQMTLSQQQQQQLLKQMQTSVASSVSPSYHLQPPQQRLQQALLLQHLSSSQKSMGLTQQQIAHLVKQQPQLTAQQQQQQQLLLQQQQQLQQQSPRIPEPANQISVTLSGPQSEAPASTATVASGSQGAEAANQILGKRKIQDLVSQVDPRCKLDPEVEDLFLEIADEFIDSVTTFACSLAKHRKSSVLEAKDVLLHLEKNWHLNIPGFSREEKNRQRNSVSNDAQKKQMEMIRLLMEPQQSERSTSGVRGTSKQVTSDAAGDHPIQPSPNAEQLSLPAVGPQMLQKVHRF